MVFLTDNIFFLEGKSEKSYSRGIGAPNSLIVTGTEHSIIIDPGVWTHQYRRLRKLKRKNIIDYTQIKKVYITHQHWDHSTLASFFQSKFNAEVFCHPKGKKAIENENVMVDNFFNGYNFLQKELTYRPMWIIKMAIHFIWGGYNKFEVNKTIKEGEKIDIETPIEVLELPGHTPCNIGFYFPEAKIIATGDLIDLDTGIGYDLNSPLSDFETAKESVSKLSRMDIETLISGHGKIVKGQEECQKLIKQRIENSEKLRKDIIKILKKEECSLRKLIFRLTGKRNVIDYLLNKHVIYCYLDHINKTEEINFRKKGRKTYLSVQ